MRLTSLWHCIPPNYVVLNYCMCFKPVLGYAHNQRLHIYYFTFSVGNAPMILSPLQDTTAIAGKSVRLECDLSLGHPKADIRWYRDARELYRSPKYKMSYDEFQNIAQCVIHQVEAGDSGKYRCEAFNRMGRAETKCRLTVNGRHAL